MTVKYYGTTYNGHLTINVLYYADANRYVSDLPASYCVWIIPGTVDPSED